MENTRLAEEEQRLTWSAPTMHDHERSPRWYAAAGIFVLVCTVDGILTGAWTFAMVMLLTAGVYFLVHRHPVPIRTISLTPQGVLFGDIFTQWSDCAGFWIVQTPLGDELHILRTRGWDREIHIHTGPMSLDRLRPFLGRFLTEKSDRSERLVDKIIRFCKL